ncbi:hypothetical protein Tco_1296803 [Tanacetum coccineum]
MTVSAPKFADSHNMVAFLAKPTEIDGFEQILDFLNANPIKYALTVNLTIYTSCIEQFWATTKVKTVNGEIQLQALVDGKKVIITETSVRRDLQLEDAEGIECLPNADILEQLALIGAKSTAWNEFSSTMASAIICLATNQKFNFSKYIFESMVKNVDSKPIADEAANEESVPTHSNDPLLNGEDNLKLNELMELCTNLQKKVLNLETSKTTQALEIESLKRRVKKLEKKQRSRTHKLRRLYKVCLSDKVVFSDDEASLGDQEDASKQERKILDIDADEDITLDSTHVDTDPDMFGVHDLHGDKDKVETDYELAQRLQQEEQEELTIEEKYKLTELVEGTKNDDQEEAKLKELMKVIANEEGVAIDAIPLSTKPPSIVDYKIIKEGKINIYQIIRADGSSKRYSTVIYMLKNFDRQDLETLWKIVKARHGYTRLEEGYERVLWG